MNKYKNHEKYNFIQSIYKNEIMITNDNAENIMKELINLGFQGAFENGDYFAWGCGSDLANCIDNIINECEKKSNINFLQVLKNLWSENDEAAKLRLLKSYLILNKIPTYKTKEKLKEEYDFSDFKKYWEILRDEWAKKGLTPKKKK